MARHSWPRKAVSALMATAVAIGALLVSAPAAQAAQTPSFTASVTEVANERIDIAIAGSGFGEVQALPGQTEPHAYFTLIEKSSDLARVQDTQAAVSASIAGDGTLGDVLSVPAANLDRTSAYEVISWPSRSFPTDANLYSRADIVIDWDALFPSGAPKRAAVALSVDPSSAYAGQAITLTATISPDIGGTVTFWNGSTQIGGAVQTTAGTAALTTTSLPIGDHGVTAHFAPGDDGYVPSTSDRVAVTVNERSTQGSVQWGVKSNFRNYVTGNIARGRIDVSHGAKQAAGNGVFTFPQAAAKPDWNGTTGTIRYAGQATFYGHSGALNHTIANPAIHIIDDATAELRIDYRGTTIAFATIDLGTATREDLAGDAVRFSGATTKLTSEGAAFFSYEKHEFYAAGEALDSITFTIGAPSDIDVSEPPLPTPTPAPGGNQNPPAAPARTQSAASAGSLTWGVSSAFAAYTTCNGKERYGYSHCAKGSIATSGVGAGYLFPQAEGGSWNRETQTGTVNYSGVVAFQGYGMTMFTVSNPSISVSGPASATLHTGNTASFGGTGYALDLSSATKTVGDNGEVTWSGVGVRGSLTGGPGGGSANSVSFDGLTFTVGAPSAQTFGATSAGSSDAAYRAAETPPTTEGLEVVTPADRIREGGRIQIAASGFNPGDTGVLVVLYPAEAGAGPIVLDDAATADENGEIRWSGMLPDKGIGDHVITLQGSTAAGAAIDILEKTASAAAPATSDADNATPISAALTPMSAGGLAPWEWWVIAVSLVAIAACTSVLVVRQRLGARAAAV